MPIKGLILTNNLRTTTKDVTVINKLQCYQQSWQAAPINENSKKKEEEIRNFHKSIKNIKMYYQPRALIHKGGKDRPVLLLLLFPLGCGPRPLHLTSSEQGLVLPCTWRMLAILLIHIADFASRIFYYSDRVEMFIQVVIV